MSFVSHALAKSIFISASLLVVWLTFENAEPRNKFRPLDDKPRLLKSREGGLGDEAGEKKKSREGGLGAEAGEKKKSREGGLGDGAGEKKKSREGGLGAGAGEKIRDQTGDDDNEKPSENKNGEGRTTAPDPKNGKDGTYRITPAPDFFGQNAGDDDVYYNNGFHLKYSWFDKVLQAEKLQPFCFMPMVCAVKLILTMVIFGHSLDFKEKTSSSCCENTLEIFKKFGQVIGGLFMMAFVLNGYYRDYLSMQAAQKHVDLDTGFKRAAVFFVICLTSSNYIACRAIWNSLQVENPVNLLDIKPKYVLLPCTQGMPLMPGAAKWLAPFRHIYALLLLPYIIPNVLSQLFICVTYCIWLCSCNCLAICWVCAGGCMCFWTFILSSITLGLWVWARHALAYWFGLQWPVLYWTALQVWASLIAPVLFSLVFGCVSGVSCKDTSEVLNELKPPSGDAEADAINPPPSFVGLETRQKLVGLNWDDKLQGDFEQPVFPDDTPESNPQVDSQGLQKTPVKIFAATLLQMSSIITEQMGLIFMIRAVQCHGFEGYMGAFFKTVTERKLLIYINHLQQMATFVPSKLLNTIWLLI